MRIDILTLFPKMFDGVFSESILKRAQKEKLISINIYDLRKWTEDKHKTVDDRIFGGGIGMLMKVDVIDKAVSKLKTDNCKVILLDAGGKKFTHQKAVELSRIDHLIFICGHYEGVDYRVHKYIADEIISIGDYVLTGGEIPAMVMVDAIARQIDGVIVKSDAIKNESFCPENCSGLLEYPQYTRPDEYKGWKVPKVLLGGNHKEIQIWRNKKALAKTKLLRPDLVKN